MRFLTLFLCTLLFPSLQAQVMKIGVLRQVKTQKIRFEIVQGTYTLVGDQLPALELNRGENCEFETNSNSRIRVTQNGKLIGSFAKVELSGALKNNIAALINLSPKVAKREYFGDFELLNREGKIDIINHVGIDHYLAGVVECEGGPGHTETYYMVQAIMSRTYAMKYQEKHARDGFQLCDQVHCQAYHHRQMKSPEIDRAVIATNGMVLMDAKNKLIDAFFHANCGGQTCDASYVWNNSISYLTPFKDTFCIKTQQARWTKTIPKIEWVDFLVEEYDYPMFDSLYAAKVFHFVQDERKAFFHGPELGIPLRDLRSRFKLKSTYFSCYESGDHVVLEGYGYGHAVGLCQEGAMEMARRGYHFTQILRYYFPGVIIRVLEKTDYFQHLEKDPLDF